MFVDFVLHAVYYSVITMCIDETTTFYIKLGSRQKNNICFAKLILYLGGMVGEWVPPLLFY